MADILAIVAIVLAVIVPTGIEYLKKPRLDIVPGNWEPQGTAPWTFAVARVVNRSLPRPFSKLFTRETAHGCKVSIEYQEWSTGKRLLPKITGRWSGHPEPRKPALAAGPFSGTPVSNSPAAPTSGPPASGAPAPPADQLVVVYDPSLDPSPTQDVAVGQDGEEVAVAILIFTGNAFAFANESYAHPLFDNPAWKLDEGDYRIIIRLTGANVQAAEKAFKLSFEDSNFAKFRLRPGD